MNAANQLERSPRHFPELPRLNRSTMSAPRETEARPLTAAMRWMLLAASVLVFVAGFQLFVLAEQTDRYFAWTINPPITAACLGAAYWASFVLELLAARQPTWARARIAVPAVLLFTSLMLAATLLHLDRFHLDTAFGWVWLAVYVGVPPIMLALLVHQLRAPGRDAPGNAPLPTLLRLALSIQAAVLLIFGAALFVAPQVMAPLWPWMLTPLTGRAVAAWLVALGVAAAHLTWENDWDLGRVAMPAYATLGGLQLVTLARYPGGLDWSGPQAWLYLLFVLSVLAVGLFGWWRSRMRAA
jgi:hypothetical protein